MSEKKNVIPYGTVEEFLASDPRNEPNTAWPEGDIREALKEREWKEVAVEVWVKLPEHSYSFLGTLIKARKMRDGWDYWLDIDSRVVRCKGERIQDFYKSSDLRSGVSESFAQLELKDLDSKSNSQESEERQRERAQNERDRYLSRIDAEIKQLSEARDSYSSFQTSLLEDIRSYLARQPLDTPSLKGSKRKDPTQDIQAIQEIMIAYLEGNDLARRKDNVNSAFFEAGAKVDKSDSAMEAIYRDWKKSQK